ncbi:hypothetical protein WJX79_004354 [Trebouxia sp. C0005]
MSAGWKWLCLVLLSNQLAVIRVAASPTGLSDSAVTGHRFSRALERASDNSYVIVTMVNAEAAKYFLPLYLRSMRMTDSELVERALIMTLDGTAHKLCTAMHQHSLCCPLDSLGDNDTNPFADHYVAQDGVDTKAYQAMGFMKVKIMLEAVELGFHILFLDVDQVILKHPLAHIDLSEDVLAARDCNLEDQTCYTKLINLGVLYFRATSRAKKILTDWYSRRHNGWDQAVFISMVVETEDGDDPPYSVARLDFEAFPNFCYQYCGEIVVPLYHRAANWRDVCPKEEVQKWVTFHVACAQDGNSNNRWDMSLSQWFVVNDVVMMKRDMLQAIWELSLSSSSSSSV